MSGSKIAKLPKSRIEMLLNTYGIQGTCDRLNVSRQALYEDIKKRKGEKEIIYRFP